MLTVGSLFAGIGGFDLGLERAGMRVIWHSEIDPYASAVLRKHWPGVPNLGDVRTITAARLRAHDRIATAADYLADTESRNVARRGHLGADQSDPEQFPPLPERRSFPDVLCGGFPCQDISNAGKRAGIGGERSGLWAEFARIIGELRPRYVIVENVAALLGRGIERVLGDLAALGFDAEWHCIPASAVGAPHRRDRVWIMAYARCDGGESIGGLGQVVGSSRSGQGDEAERQRIWDAAGSSGAHVADASNCRCEGAGNVPCACGQARQPCGSGEIQHATHYAAIGEGIRQGDAAGQWWTEPDVGRVAHGIPARVDRLRCLGNAIVPQIAEIIGRAIVRAA